MGQAGEFPPPTAASVDLSLAAPRDGPTPSKAYGIATDHQFPTDAAAGMIDRGGHAFDAAVAARFVLSVCRPFACGIGGGGFMVISLPGKKGRVERALNYRKMCPTGINAESFSKPGLPPISASLVVWRWQLLKQLAACCMHSRSMAICLGRWPWHPQSMQQRMASLWMLHMKMLFLKYRQNLSPAMDIRIGFCSYENICFGGTQQKQAIGLRIRKRSPRFS